MLNTKEARGLAERWVSATMAAEVESRAAKREAGTPVDGLPDNDREALAHAVAKALDTPFIDDPHDEHGLAWDLCELAGWPDDEEEAP